MSRIAEPSSQKSEDSQSQQSPSPTRSKLVQRLLEASDNLPQFINDLVTTQAVVVAGTEAAAFLLQQKGEQATLECVTHIRPDESDEETRTAAVAAFKGIVDRCVVEGKDGVIDVGAPDMGEPQFCLVTLLRNEGQLVGVSAVITRALDRERAKQRLQSMQLVAGYFELYSLRRFVEQAQVISERHQQVLQYTGAVATAEGFESAAMNLCNELATRAGASRVSLGWIKGVQIKIKALSHTEKFDKKQELIVLLEKVMEECLDQEEPVRYDPSGKSSGNVTRAAAELSRSQGGTIVLSVPLRQREDIVGVMTVEWPAGEQVDEQDEAGISVAGELLAPQLYDRYQNDRYIVTKIGLSIKNIAKATIGPKHTGVKLLIAMGIGLIAFVCLFKPMYHVRAAVVLNALDRKSIGAPFDGILEDVFIRPGQPVKTGDVIAKMKTVDMEVKLAQVKAQVKSKEYQADKARKEGKPAEERIAEAERRDYLAQQALLEYYVDQASLKSPITGLLLKGDLMDRKGQKVKEGEPLFEVGRGDAQDPTRLAVEAEMMVSERDIQELAAAVRKRHAIEPGVAIKPENIDGSLATTSFPEQDFKFVVTRLVPVGEPKEGENVFRVYGTITEPAAWMHPGLAGEARVDIAPRSLAWMWTHRLADWVKLKLWI